MSEKNKRIDIHATTSNKKGFSGIFESFLRTFKGIAFALAMAPVLPMYLFCMGVSLAPGVYIVQFVYNLVENSSAIIQCLAIATSLSLAYFVYGICLIFVVPFLNWILFLRIKPWRGSWHSLETLPWYYHNALTQLVRYTFLTLVTPTPLNLIFYKLMGMRIGKNVVINTTNISDPALITMEDNVTIGGSATIFAHYAQAGFLVLAPVIIKKGATIGLKASIMGDVIVGEKVVVAPHAVLLPKSRPVREPVS